MVFILPVLFDSGVNEISVLKRSLASELMMGYVVCMKHCECVHT